MHHSRFAAAVLLLGLGALPAWPADLGKIPRTLAREPAYQSKDPKYCLLVFGPDAQTRVWLVRDGDALYVDRNGNGDLTDAGECLTRTGSTYNLGPITAADGSTTFGSLTMHTNGDQVRLYHEVPGGCKQYAGYNPSDRLTFANRAQDAPIVHFGGPLTLRIYQQMPAFVAGQLCRFNIILGTPGVGTGAFASVSCCSLPEGVRPLALVEFPHRDPTKAPIRVEYILDGD